MYLPYNERTADYQYIDALKKILESGVRTGSATEVGTITYVGIQQRYKVENGAPLITIRDFAPIRKKSPTIWQQAIGELLGFINGAQTQKDLSSFGCYWWRHWVTEEKCLKRNLETGDLGKGSYGHSFANHETKQGSFDQFGGVMLQMKERPEIKTHVITPWQPQFILRTSQHKQQVVVCPCHGWMHFIVHEQGLSLHMWQRSGDMPVGVPNNMIQYFALLLAVAKYIDVKPYEFVHTISDAHIYENQIEKVRELIKIEPKPFPTLNFDGVTGKDPRDYRYTDFSLSDYYPNQEVNFPVVI